MRKDILRVGDYVRIITPERFIRCGYPLSHGDEFVSVKQELEPHITDFLKEKCGINRYPETFSSDENHQASRLIDKIISAIAYYRVKQKGFGGRTRQIFTESCPDLVGKEGNISKIFFVKTGEYYSPSGGYGSYSNEYDYDPGGLRNEKTHKILELWVPGYSTIQIEAKNVERVVYDEF